MAGFMLAKVSFGSVVRVDDGEHEERQCYQQIDHDHHG